MPQDSSKPSPTLKYAWVNVVVASLLMLATLPGRTQGLGLITEPLLRELGIERLAYANINLWATLLGAACCLPAGYLIDRFGLRLVSTAFLVLLGLTVWRMSTFAGGLVTLFLFVLLTRAFGQSALSVVSITCVGKSFGKRVGFAMGIYSVLLSILFAAAFGAVGNSVTTRGWRDAWFQIAAALLFGITPVVLIFLREESTSNSSPIITGLRSAAPANPSPDFTLPQALRTPAFWIFGGSTALFGLVSSGLGLFNEAVLAERGFDQKTYHLFLVVTTLISLLGQSLCGWGALRWPLQRLMAVGMVLYASALAMLPWVKTLAQLWIFAALIGGAGGMIIVTFFAIWSRAFGRAHLGRIQGGAQILTVTASAAGPLLLTKCALITGSYTASLLGLAPTVFLLGVAAWRVSMPRPKENAESALLPDPAAG
jgi:MFS family permease